MKSSWLRRGMNLWPPFLFSGIKITHMGEDYRSVTVELRQRFYNKNYVGTHFGGSIFAMCDPFHMMMMMNNLPRDYTVWDKAGSVEFIKPGYNTLTANFELHQHQIDAVFEATPNPDDKVTPTFSVDVLNEDGVVVAKVHKTLHIRKRRNKRKRIKH